MFETSFAAIERPIWFRSSFHSYVRNGSKPKPQHEACADGDVVKALRIHGFTINQQLARIFHREKERENQHRQHGAFLLTQFIFNRNQSLTTIMDIN